MTIGFGSVEVERNSLTGEVSINTRIGSRPFKQPVEPQKWQTLLQEAKSWRESAERRRNMATNSRGPVVHESDSAMGAKILSTILPSTDIKDAFLRELALSSAPFRFSVLGQDQETISIPWETCSHADWRMLHLDPEEIRSLSRSDLVVLRVPGPLHLQQYSPEEPIKIMTVASIPRDILPTNHDLEERIIEQSLHLKLREDRYRMITVENLNELDLGKRVRNDNPHILHIMAHGENGQLLAEDTQSNLIRLGGEQLADILRDLKGSQGERRSLVLFVSTACELMQTSGDIFGLEVGPALADVIPFSIGMQLPVSPTAAQIFSQEFYAAVGDSKSIIDSFLHARGALLNRLPRSSAWVAPVLYVASHYDCVLFEVDDTLYRLRKFSRGLEELIKALSADPENKLALDRVKKLLLALDDFYEDHKNQTTTSRMEIRSDLARIVEFANEHARKNLWYVQKYVESGNVEWYFDKNIPDRSVALGKALRKIRDDIDGLCGSLGVPSSDF